MIPRGSPLPIILPKFSTTSRLDHREQRMQDVLDPDDGRAAAWTSRMVSTSASHSPSVRPPAISSSSSIFGSVASARASSSRLRSSRVSETPTRLALGEQTGLDQDVGARSPTSASRLPGPKLAATSSSRTPSASRKAAESGTSGRCRRGIASAASARDVRPPAGSCRRRRESRRRSG